jgi:hypothetical protein
MGGGDGRRAEVEQVLEEYLQLEIRQLALPLL